MTFNERRIKQIKAIVDSRCQGMEKPDLEKYIISNFSQFHFPNRKVAKWFCNNILGC